MFHRNETNQARKKETKETKGKEGKHITTKTNEKRKQTNKKATFQKKIFWLLFVCMGTWFVVNHFITATTS